MTDAYFDAPYFEYFEELTPEELAWAPPTYRAQHALAAAIRAPRPQPNPMFSPRTIGGQIAYAQSQLPGWTPPAAPAAGAPQAAVRQYKNTIAQSHLRASRADPNTALKRTKRIKSARGDLIKKRAAAAGMSANDYLDTQRAKSSGRTLEQYRAAPSYRGGAFS